MHKGLKIKGLGTAMGLSSLSVDSVQKKLKNYDTIAIENLGDDAVIMTLTQGSSLRTESHLAGLLANKIAIDTIKKIYESEGELITLTVNTCEEIIGKIQRMLIAASKQRKKQIGDLGINIIVILLTKIGIYGFQVGAGSIAIKNSGADWELLTKITAGGPRDTLVTQKDAKEKMLYITGEFPENILILAKGSQDFFIAHEVNIPHREALNIMSGSFKKKFNKSTELFISTLKQLIASHPVTKVTKKDHDLILWLSNDE